MDGRGPAGDRRACGGPGRGEGESGGAASGGGCGVRCGRIDGKCEITAGMNFQTHFRALLQCVSGGMRNIGSGIGWRIEWKNDSHQWDVKETGKRIVGFGEK